MDILAIHNAPDVIAARTAAIRATMLRISRCVTQANFERISADDLRRLFDLYDDAFFGGRLIDSVRKDARATLTFRLSSTMTRAGGKTTRCKQPLPGGKQRPQYEIAVASRMLFMNFRDGDKPVIVCGLSCSDRLAALQRVMEHELIHLAEFLTWGNSSCSRPRFKKLALSIFGHTDTKHSLMTPREHAVVQHGISVGAIVQFDYAGRRLAGRVNRIHQRATVLVEDAKGRPYSDGRKYLKFYVPLPQLKPQVATAP